MRRFAGCLLAISSLTAVSLRGVAQGDAMVAATQPAAAKAEARTADAVAAIGRLVDGGRLRLGTEVERAPARFHFVLRLSSEPKAGDPQYTDYVVVKRDKHVGVLVRSLDGLPYCYLTEGQLLVLDHANPGRIKLYRGGAPSVVFRMGEQEGQLDMWISHARRAEQALVDVNLAPVLRALLPRVRQATYERSSGTVIARTDRSALMLTLPAFDQPGQFGLRSFATSTPDGHTIALLEPASNTDSPLAFEKVDRDAITAAGLDVRDADRANGSDISLLVPHDFGNDPKEQDAAHKLREILVKRPR